MNYDPTIITVPTTLLYCAVLSAHYSICTPSVQYLYSTVQYPLDCRSPTVIRPSHLRRVETPQTLVLRQRSSPSMTVLASAATCAFAFAAAQPVTRLRHVRHRRLYFPSSRRLLCTATTTNVTAESTTPATFTLEPPTSAYIHLPFCAQRCAYCAFPIIVSGRTSLPSSSSSLSSSDPHPSHVTYIDLLTREISAFFRHRPTVAPLQTLYLGGGTPSLLHPNLLSRLLSHLSNHVPLAPAAELTCEMDPATFTADSARAFAALGVTRASVGAQTFDDDALSACNRVHRARDIPLAVSHLRAAGISSISLDLISALPGQTMHSWQQTLSRALALNPDHLSIYDLTLEPNTPFATRYVPGVSPLPADATAADMLAVAARTLADAGFEHYEVSNFARGASPTSHRSRHNMAYWRSRPFYAFGLGATSLVDGVRFARPRRLRDYARYVDLLETLSPSSFPSTSSSATTSVSAEKNELREHHLFPGVRTQSPQEELEDFLINSLRLLVDGVDVHELASRFGHTVHADFLRAVQRCQQLEQQGLLEVLRNHDDVRRVRLTERGALFENHVVSDLMLESVWRDNPPSDTE